MEEADQVESGKAVLAAQAARAGAVHKTHVSAAQLARDEETRARAAVHQEQTEQSGKVLAAVKSATGNAFARQGLHPQDVDQAVRLIAAGTPWPQVKRALCAVADKAMEAWRAELERRAALGPGGEPHVLSKPNAPVDPGSFHQAELARGDTLVKG